MSRYAIWNKEDDVFTPSGAKFTAAEWKERYPISTVDSVKIVCGGGVLNGAFFGILSEMVEMYTKSGCDFSACVEDQDYLDAIEAFEDQRNAPSERVSNEELTATSLASIAASMEYQNLASLPDVDVTEETTTTEEVK